MMTKPFRKFYKSYALFTVLFISTSLLFSANSQAVLSQSGKLRQAGPMYLSSVTMSAFENTRTAIALTRNPLLATPRTPAPIELTATTVNTKLLQTSTALAQPDVQDNFMQTATAIIAHITETTVALTHNPTLALTASPTYPPTVCTEPNLVNYAQSELTERIQEAVLNSKLENTFVSVVTVGISTGGQCEDFAPFETTFMIYTSIDELSIATLAEHVRQILAILENFPTQENFGPEPPRLFIRFEYKNNALLIDTGYENARSAFVENLGDSELLDALGKVMRSQ